MTACSRSHFIGKHLICTIAFYCAFVITSPIAAANIDLFTTASSPDTLAKATYKEGIDLTPNIDSLFAQPYGATVHINLPNHTFQTKLEKRIKGQFGSETLVLKGNWKGLPLHSYVTLSSNRVFIELITPEGNLTGRGNTRHLKLQSLPLEKHHHSLPPAAVTHTNPMRQFGSGSVKQAAATTPDFVSTPATQSTHFESNASIIDLLIVYTPETQNSLDSDITGYLDHLVNYANDVMTNSHVDIQLRVSATSQTEQEFDDSQRALFAMTFADPPFENLKTLRARSGADLVVLLHWTETLPQRLGTSWAINPASVGAYRLMYSAVNVGADASTFTHEIGHNLGLNHSRSQGEVGASYDYAVGFRAPLPESEGFGTIMAYRTEDTIRLPLFSNPALSCSGLPCGIPRSDEELGSDAVYAMNQIRQAAELMSPETPSELTVTQALEQITDSALKQCIENAVMFAGNPQYAVELQTLRCDRDAIESLQGLSGFNGLKSVEFNHNNISDLSELGEISTLNSIIVTHNPVSSGFSDIARLKFITDLRLGNIGLNDDELQLLLPALSNVGSLALDGNELETLPDLSALTSLFDLLLANNAIDSIESLGQMRTLRFLDVGNNPSVVLPQDPVTWPLMERLTLDRNGHIDFAGITNLPKLTQLNIAQNNVDSLTPFVSMPALESLVAVANNITSLEGLENFPDLQRLDLSFNPLESSELDTISANLTHLSLDNTGLVDLDFVEKLPELRSLGIDSNGIEDISPLQVLAYLEDVSLSDNPINNISLVSNMSTIRKLNAKDIEMTDLDFLSNMYNLQSLSIGSAALRDLKGAFELAGLRFLTLSSGQPYCWQQLYAKNYIEQEAMQNYGYAEFFFANTSCSDAQNADDFDLDGTSNIDEINNGTDPTNNASNQTQISLQLSNIQIDETGHPVRVPLYRSGDLAKSSTLQVNTIADTALPDVDFFSIDEVITFAPGIRRKLVNVSILSDVPSFETEEPGSTEQFFVELSEAQEATIIGESQATITLVQPPYKAPEIIDESDQAYLEWSAPYILLNQDASRLEITLLRSRNTSAEVSLQLDWQNIVDATLLETLNSVDQIRFESGETEKTITIDLPSELALEQKEYVMLHLRSDNEQVSFRADRRTIYLVFEADSAGTDFDFDGDGKADIGVRRTANTTWYVNNSSGNDAVSNHDDGITRLVFGRQSEDIPVPADYDGDGITDYAVRRPANHTWYVRNSSGVDNITNYADGITRLIFGRQDTDIPVPADYDGDGKADFAVRRPDNQTWYIKNSSGEDTVSGNLDGITRLVFGRQADDIPVPADYDGDGKADIAVRRPVNQTWYIRNSQGEDLISGFADGITRLVFGKQTTDIPVPADYDKDGKVDVAVRRPGNQTWYVRNSSGTDLLTSNNDGISRLRFGLRSEDIPVPADYDGDGIIDIAVRRPGNTTWYVRNSSGSDLLTGYSDGISRLVFGKQTTDIPVSAPIHIRIQNPDSWPEKAQTNNTSMDTERLETRLNTPSACYKQCEEWLTLAGKFEE